jgi:hypothetical protein
MSAADAMREDRTVEECLDELAEMLDRLRGYPLSVLAVALRVHLQALLQVMLVGELCTRPEVRAFLRELEREALEFEGETGTA